MNRGSTMKILLSLLLILLILATSGLHIYYVWKRKDYKTLVIQLGIIGLTIIFGIFTIYTDDLYSISKLLNMMNPFGV